MLFNMLFSMLFSMPPPKKKKKKKKKKILAITFPKNFPRVIIRSKIFSPLYSTDNWFISTWTKITKIYSKEIFHMRFYDYKIIMCLSLRPNDLPLLKLPSPLFRFLGVSSLDPSLLFFDGDHALRVDLLFSFSFSSELLKRKIKILTIFRFIHIISGI